MKRSTDTMSSDDTQTTWSKAADQTRRELFFLSLVLGEGAPFAPPRAMARPLHREPIAARSPSE